MLEHSDQLDALAAALTKAQATVKGAVKDSENPHFRSKYADLASVWEACRDALTRNGLSVVQLPGYADGVATLDTMLLHTSGQWIRGTAGAPLGKQDAQGVGSALTYLRRYALAAVASVCPEDDDGEAAVNRKAPQPLHERPRALSEPEPPAPWDGDNPPAAWRKPWPFGALKGRELHTLTSDELAAQVKWAEKAGRGLDLVDTMREILASREGE
jgi:hypothetical protein